MFKRIVYGLVSIAVLVAAMSFNNVPGRRIYVRFVNFVGDKPLKFDSVTYTNYLEQNYKITMFKYYVGNFHFVSKNHEDINDGYYLINQDNPSSMLLSLYSPDDVFSEASFTLGVDSTDNCSGAQSGALDPINGMFWAWNSGYIFLKMEGISSVSNSIGKRLEFHIGGYKSPNNCIRRIRIKRSFKINDTLIIKTDLSRLFAGRNTIDFSKISSVTDFHHAAAIADNYSGMFSIR